MGTAMRSGTTGTGLIGGVRYDVKRLHESWMELFFPRQRATEGTVLGKWKPSTTPSRAAYRAWATFGALVVGLLYPLVLLGFASRYYTRRIDGTAARLGVFGVVVLSLVIWGGLAALARLRFSTSGFIAVTAAGVAATVAAALAYVTSRYGGRVSTVAFAYPFGMTALFLPPVVAALYSPTLSSVIFPKSTTIAKWVLDHLLAAGGINDYLRTRYDLKGLAYVGMWFAIAVPLGWLVGSVVSLANLVRPS